MPEMISKVAHIYAGRQLSAGERFHADKEFVPALIGLGRAELVPMQSEARQYRARDMAATAPAEYQRRDLRTAEPPARQKRKYKRRQAV